MSYARAHAADLSSRGLLRDADVHVPRSRRGLVQRWASAGITMAAAMISSSSPPYSARRRHDREITLQGECVRWRRQGDVLSAGRRSPTIILPKLNRRDVVQITPRILQGVTFRYVENVEEVLAAALLPAEEAREKPPEEAERAAEIPVATERRRRASPRA